MSLHLILALTATAVDKLPVGDKVTHMTKTADEIKTLQDTVAAEVRESGLVAERDAALHAAGFVRAQNDDLSREASVLRRLLGASMTASAELRVKVRSLEIANEHILMCREEAKSPCRFGCGCDDDSRQHVCAPQLDEAAQLRGAEARRIMECGEELEKKDKVIEALKHERNASLQAAGFQLSVVVELRDLVVEARKVIREGGELNYKSFMYKTQRFEP